MVDKCDSDHKSHIPRLKIIAITSNFFSQAVIRQRPALTSFGTDHLYETRIELSRQRSPVYRLYPEKRFPVHDHRAIEGCKSAVGLKFIQLLLFFLNVHVQRN
jgi:hypothetical protein